MMFAERYITKFWAKVNKTDDCWEWTASTASGYGQYGYKLGKWDYKIIQAHRYSWILHNGAIPKDLHVCHHCDNRKCVRPEHLFLGTRNENMADMVSKGRSNQGERHPLARITAQDAREIFVSDLPKQKLAERYGIIPAHVVQIQTFRRWQSVTRDLKDSADERMRAK